MNNRVRELRKVAELTQIQLSERSGVSLPTIRRIESGRNVSIPVLIKLSETLKCTLNDLIPSRDLPKGGG